ncbi:hypothetical protein E3N88_28582 [Mikania micrantha]|uniref:Uncharacterized protein n=1 Tax=Mikania micrantha TaxID=192012 RepID=A0A5N6N0F5_9ASTR|nr:hypothetical protein E3N88_28582 [Mikania micrantha]
MNIQRGLNIVPTPHSPMMIVELFFLRMCAYIGKCYRHSCANLNICFNNLLEYFRHIWEYANEVNQIGIISGETTLVVTSLFSAYALQFYQNPPSGLYRYTRLSNGEISDQAGKAIASYNNRVVFRQGSGDNYSGDEQKKSRDGEDGERSRTFSIATQHGSGDNYSDDEHKKTRDGEDGERSRTFSAATQHVSR